MTAPQDGEQTDEELLMAAAAFAIRRHLAGHPTPRRQMDDVVSDAHYGAASAFLRYDPAGGATLFSYVFHRAAGAIKDGIRDRSPMSRAEYARGGDLAAIVAQRTPASLEALADSGWVVPSPRTGYEQTEDHDQVVRMLEGCSPSEQLVLVAVVMYGFGLTEVACWLGVTVSRASQIQHRALARLRSVVTS